MRDSFTDEVGRKLTEEYGKSKISYEKFFNGLADRHEWELIELRNDVLEAGVKRHVFVTAFYLMNDRIIEVYHKMGRKGIYAKY